MNKSLRPGIPNIKIARNITQFPAFVPGKNHNITPSLKYCIRPPVVLPVMAVSKETGLHISEIKLAQKKHINSLKNINRSDILALKPDTPEPARAANLTNPPELWRIYLDRRNSRSEIKTDELLVKYKNNFQAIPVVTYKKIGD